MGGQLPRVEPGPSIYQVTAMVAFRLPQAALWPPDPVSIPRSAPALPASLLSASQLVPPEGLCPVRWFFLPRKPFSQISSLRCRSSQIPPIVWGQGWAKGGPGSAQREGDRRLHGGLALRDAQGVPHIDKGQKRHRGATHAKSWRSQRSCSGERCH